MEDESQDFELFRHVLANAVADRADMEDKRCKTPQEACEEIKRHSGNYDVFVADILFPKPEQKNELDASGILAVEEAATKSNLIIVGLSAAPARYSEIRERFYKAGGMFFIDKRDLRGSDVARHQEIKADFVALLEDKGILPVKKAHLRWKAGKDIYLDAVIEEIGETALRELLDKVEPGQAYFVPCYVRPGRSGAVLLRAQGYAVGAEYPNREVLLKCGTSVSKLQRELAGLPKPTEPGRELYVNYSTITPVSDRNRSWYAIAARFQEDAVELDKWLSQEKVDRTKTAEVFRELCKALNLAYRNGKEVPDSALSLLLLPGSYKARILASLPSLIAILRKVMPDERIDMSTFDAFLRDGKVVKRTLSSIPPGTFQCICHGDLHTRNILVTKGDRPRAVLIDPAKRGLLHWASDAERLCRDLWVSVWDAGPEAYLWDQLATWRRAVIAWFESNSGSVNGTSQRNQNVLEALCCVRSHLPEDIGSRANERRWEFQAALTREFLQACPYEDIPAPKRCLALIVAHDLLGSLEERLPHHQV